MDMQNVSNLVIPEGEVKAIHDKNNIQLWGRLNYDTKYAGDTSQPAYSGKNLFNINEVPSWTGSNTTYSVNGNTLHVEGYWYVGITVQVEANTNYYFSALRKNTSGSDTAGKVSIYTEPNGSTIVNLNKENGTFNSGNRTSVVILFRCGSANPGSVDYENIQVEKGTTQSSYEPYTGSTPTQTLPSPNPSYPQLISVVTGNQTITVSDGVISQDYTVNLTSKNLFNCPSSANTTNTVFTKIDSNSFKTEFTKTTTTNQSAFTQIPLLGLSPNTTYTISLSPEVTGDSYSRAGQFRMHIGSSWSSFYNGKATFTTTTNVSNIFLAVSNAQDVTTPGSNSVTFSNVQLEVGSTSTPFVPYYNYELCKIGTYQDYIYKSGEDWYVHKETNKLIANSSQEWTYSEGTAPTNTRFGCVVNDAALEEYTASQPSIVMSNCFRGTTWYNLYRSIAGDNVVSLKENAHRIYVHMSSLTTIDAWNTFITNNTVLFRYVLATPTDTKITDATLIGQLNAVHEWLTRYGYSSNVTGNLPIIIDRTNL